MSRPQSRDMLEQMGSQRTDIPTSLERIVDALAIVAESSADLVFAAERNHRIVYLNLAARNRWGDCRGQLAIEALPGHCHADFGSCVTTVFETRTSARFEWGELGGEVRMWFCSTVSPLGDAPQQLGYLCVSSDATSLKRAEQRLLRSEQLMIEAQAIAHLGMWEWTVTEPVVTWSAELYRIYDVTPETYTPTYEGYLAKVHPDDRGRVAAATERVFREHVPYSHDERIYRPDGSIRYLHTWAHSVVDADGKLIQLVGICQDITEQKVAEENFRQLNVELERRVADRTRVIETTLHDLEAFNATISHDLRAPLQVIQLSTDLLRATANDLPTRAADKLDRIQHTVAHMSGLVEALLSLARVGQTVLRSDEIDLSALCIEVTSELRRMTPERLAEITIEHGLRCTADLRLVRVAMTNLLANAWKYSSRAPATRIDVGSVEQDRQTVMFVRDNGVGFEMSEQAKLFRAFERLNTGLDFPGTGVGLATVHRIIERHGGRIWAESAVGHGATFFVALPSLRCVRA